MGLAVWPELVNAHQAVRARAQEVRQTAGRRRVLMGVCGE